MLATTPTPRVRLSNLFPNRQVYAECEHLAPSGCFKTRGDVPLLNCLAKLRLVGDGGPEHYRIPLAPTGSRGSVNASAPAPWLGRDGATL
jgi:hypothetical protein